MKILYTATVSSMVNSFLVPHIQLLTLQGNTVDIACNVDEAINPELTRSGCIVHDIEFQRSPLKKENIKAFRKIKKLVMEENYELIHAHTPVASFLTRFACRNMPWISTLYTVHGYHFFKRSPLKNWLLYYPVERLVSRWTDGLITMNEEDYISARRMTLRKDGAVYKVNGVGVDMDRFTAQTRQQRNSLRKIYNYKEEDFILVYAAELSYRKHQDVLIEAVHLLKTKISDIKLILAGEGDMEDSYKRQAVNLNVENNIEFLGHRDDISNLMMIADAAVSSSRQEGLPVNVMEAMATGLPLVVTDCRGNRDLVKNGENGFVIENHNVNQFADAIHTLYESRNLSAQYGQHSRKIMEVYSLEKVIKQMDDIYSDYITKENQKKRG
ncbi:glycosyltransferase family 1 protein [Salibacterium salarium]|uniref:Glycosyltransferase family 1 protein n=1 Tax=Salibacterium salarium TaxID=284579 RepID=A0A3R9P5X8_9BACI|nr:glycosyltransferase family 4 protein [Salibacterium salarium]RSL31916.1 glycosyltransferase family 1 protein [Salibacterium salarium]